MRRILALVVVVAILALVVALLVPHTCGLHAPNWMAFLPVLFVGLLAPLAASTRLMAQFRCCLPCSPERTVRFQRLPPFRCN
jgi:hypothetical protein